MIIPAILTVIGSNVGSVPYELPPDKSGRIICGNPPNPRHPRSIVRNDRGSALSL